VWDPCYQGSEDLSAALLVTLVKRYIYYCKFRNMKVTIRLIKQFCINSDMINIIYLFMYLQLFNDDYSAIHNL
jgi:hypothetical protein